MSHPTSAPPQPSPTSTGRPQGAGTGPVVQRQFVNFSFYKLDPEFRRSSADEKRSAREEFLALFAAPHPGLICLTYSTAGLRPEVDFLLWRISLSADDFQAQTGAINKTGLGGYLKPP